MKEHDKLEMNERSRSNGNAGESRIVKFADSYEILEPQEAPDFRGYARILRKRFPTVLIVFSILFSIALIATLKQKPVYRAQVLLEIQKKIQTFPPFRTLRTGQRLRRLFAIAVHHPGQRKLGPQCD